MYAAVIRPDWPADNKDPMKGLEPKKPSSSIGQLFEQRFCVLQVGGVEAFGEPAIDFGEDGTSLGPPIGVAQHSREAGGCAQLVQLCALAARDLDRVMESGLRLTCRVWSTLQRQLSL